MKTTKYRICWKSLIHEGVGGKSDPIYDYDTAVKIADETYAISQMQGFETIYYIEPVKIEEETK